MKRFALIHIGFETPTPEIMATWKGWFASVADRTVEHMGLRSAREISREGTRDLPFGLDALTGITIIQAESMEEAEALATANPFITSIRIYEVAAH
jgi:hypothetical protein